jgi:hypothetical protein
VRDGLDVRLTAHPSENRVGQYVVLARGCHDSSVVQVWNFMAVRSKGHAYENKKTRDGPHAIDSISRGSARVLPAARSNNPKSSGTPEGIQDAD